MCWWFRLFPSKCLIQVEKAIRKYQFFNKFEPTQGWISFSTLLEHPKKLIFKVKIIITCILRSILVFQKREHGVLWSVTYVLIYENIFFGYYLKAEASNIISCKFPRVSFFYEQAPNFWKMGSKIDDFFAKNFNIFA